MMLSPSARPLPAARRAAALVRPRVGGRLLPDEVGEWHAERLGDEQQVGEPGVTHGAFVALNAAALYPRPLGELVLGQAGALSKCGDPAAKHGLPGEDPVGAGVAAGGHSTNGLGHMIMSQYPNGRFL